MQLATFLTLICGTLVLLYDVRGHNSVILSVQPRDCFGNMGSGSEVGFSTWRVCWGGPQSILIRGVFSLRGMPKICGCKLALAILMSSELLGGLGTFM